MKRDLLIEHQSVLKLLIAEEESALGVEAAFPATMKLLEALEELRKLSEVLK